jgi:hypothetical protein
MGYVPPASPPRLTRQGIVSSLAVAGLPSWVERTLVCLLVATGLLASVGVGLFGYFYMLYRYGR